MKSILSMVIGASLACCAIEAGAEEPTFQKVQLDIARQSLNDALNAWAEQTGFQLVCLAPEVARELVAPKVKGAFTAMGALEQLLEGTPLVYEFTSERTVTVRARFTAASQTTGYLDRVDVPRLQIAALGTADERSGQAASSSNASSATDSRANRSSSPDRGDVEELEEIVVTGTHIRGLQSSASPVYVYTREDLDRAGIGSVQQFVQRLPQNFSNTTDNTASAIPGTAGATINNRVSASGVNLRGLGPDSTLVLVNGRRVAPGNFIGNFVDVSQIPLAAVDRIEVVPDGASAVYGSDAVGGVVNFVLRRDFEGSETRARYGSVTSGGRNELQVAETLGHKWENGTALLSYEYNKTDALSAKDRAYAADAEDPFKLLPEQERHGVFATVEQHITPTLSFFADGSYAKRTSSTDLVVVSLNQHLDSDNESYSATAGVRADISDAAVIEVSGTYASGMSRRNTIEIGDLVADERGDPTVVLMDATMSGDLWTTPAGQILYAVGGQYRRESFELADLLNGNSFDNDRNVAAGYAELQVPLLAGRKAGARSLLELSLADRQEHYSDFGSTNNPKVGMIWRPSSDVTIRGTYGKSFRAPALNDLNGKPSFAAPIPLFDPQTGDFTNTLFVAGGNTQLKPEKAKTWTFGFDVHPEALPGLRATATYYNVQYNERIADPQASVLIFDFLQNEAALGPSVIQRNPSLSRVEELAASAGDNFIDFFGIPLDTITAIADSRLHNLSSVETDGVDFGLSYSTDTRFGSVESGIEGSKILKFDNRFLPTSPLLEVLDTPYNPLDLHLRARVQVRNGGANLGVYVNYADSYENKSGGVPVPVESWTTADVVFGYDFTEEWGLLKDLSLSLGALNVFDEDPPFLANPDFPIHFDGANASPLGRFVYFQVLKRL